MLALTCALLGAGVAAPGLAAAEPATPGDDGEAWIGDAVCRGCHVVEASHWDGTVHARAFAHPRTPAEQRACEACHGPGGKHLASPTDPAGILAFTSGSNAPVEAQNDACLSCHAGGGRIHWTGSRHEMADVACSDCHNPMASESRTSMMRESTVSRTCFGCHPEQRAQFRKRSHMPLLEGKVSCEDCHQPHGSPVDPLLRGDSTNDVCYTCHADKRGPFLWEHAPVRDSCTNCHHPHGSNHVRLLVTTPTLLCQTCHSQLDHPSDLISGGNLTGGVAPDERALNRGCVGCHVQIHGSNHPSGPLFHR